MANGKFMGLKPLIREYKRPNFSITITEKGKNKVLETRLLRDIKNCKYHSLKNACGDFASYKEKGIFIKKTKSIFDSHQLSDYQEQRKLISNIPEVYGYVKVNRELILISRNIPDAVPLLDLLNEKNFSRINELRTEIETIGKRLISKNLLPWDFKLRQFFYSKYRKKLYFADNAVAFQDPDQLYALYKKCNLKIPKELYLLNLAYKGNPIKGSFKLARQLVGIKPEIKVSEKLINKKGGVALIKLKNKIFSVATRQDQIIAKRTIEFYNKLDQKTKKIIQEKILDLCLKNFDNIVK